MLLFLNREYTLNLLGVTQFSRRCLGIWVVCERTLAHHPNSRAFFFEVRKSYFFYCDLPEVFSLKMGFDGFGNFPRQARYGLKFRK
jgi:hypothetical protein